MVFEYLLKCQHFPPLSCVLKELDSVHILTNYFLDNCAYICQGVSFSSVCSIKITVCDFTIFLRGCTYPTHLHFIDLTSLIVWDKEYKLRRSPFRRFPLETRCHFCFMVICFCLVSECQAIYWKCSAIANFNFLTLPEGNKRLVGPRLTWEDNIKKDLKEIGRYDADCINLVQDNATGRILWTRQ
jgi:hypothetical protein